MQPKVLEPAGVTQQRCVVLGRVGAAYGIRGWFHLHPFADDPEAWLSMPSWWITAQEPDAEGVALWRSVKPEALRLHGDGVVVKLTESVDRNAAEALRGCWIGAPRDSLPEPQDNEFYWADLMGLAVFNTQGDSLGRVDRMIETGANSVLIVVDDTQAKGQERLIPFVDRVVRQVDKASGRIVVDWGLDW